MNAVRKFLPFLFALTLVSWLALSSGITLDEAFAGLARIDGTALTGILLATGVFLALSALKWRKVMAHLAPQDDHHRGWSYGFYHTALGAVLSLVLLPQAAMLLARSYGDKVRLGKSPTMTAAATLYEQLFDLVPILVFATTALMAQMLGWGGGRWMLATMVVTLVCGLAIALMLRTRFWLLARYAPDGVRGKLAPHLEWFASPAAQGLLRPQFTLAIYAISVVRYLVLLARCYLVFAPMHLSLDSFAFIRAYAMVSVSRLLVVTPGGLGIAEWSWSGVLGLLGLPVGQSVGFILANRAFNWLSILVVFALTWAGYAMHGGRKQPSATDEPPHA